MKRDTGVAMLYHARAIGFITGGKCLPVGNRYLGRSV